MYFGGIDIGSLSTDAVIIDESRKIAGVVVMPTGASVKKAAEAAFAQVLEACGIGRADVKYIVSSGYGRTISPIGDEQITEITCHGRGAKFEFPGTGTVIDIGGQDSKVIKVDENGRVLDFAMNDKCAAGTGRFLEVMARTLEIDLDEMGGMALNSQKVVSVSSMCTVFAESEVVSLIAEGNNVTDIVAGICKAIADRVSGMVERVGKQPELTMSGGVAKNIGVVKALEKRLGMKVNIPEEPQITGALGAALIAREKFLKKLNG